MNVSEEKIAELVEAVLQEMGKAPAKKKPAGQIPKTAKVAMLTALKKFEVKEFPIPENRRR